MDGSDDLLIQEIRALSASASEKRYGEYRTKRMLLENYDALEERFG
ncbi:MAG: hypothetical protein H8E47_01125 [Anaerolineales bacterium]|nr:hypothetical protein [Anaerolineales bacterium]